MASCCKKGGGQKGNNCHRQTCSGTTGITVLMRDWVVVAGADLRLYVISPWAVCDRESHHVLGLAGRHPECRTIAHQPAHSPQRVAHSL
ncbi:TPA: hypothetical protein MH711_16960 [Klebsiella pneumoniae]|nr:hypothetical protein [Klebsiella pneumoniae]HBX6567432.1 hypothetical protein [Klebsiella pneumoniae]HBX6572958.1 hypothetical protein [Klebsiella pneumoniae]HBX6578522.1 hypothetical protein [Klebsiella pneumoniae]HBX6584065.1 hypothetical protein [Klebsiella pneumoniae]